MKKGLFAIVISLIILASCSKQEDKFTGFTAVGINKKLAKYYIDTNTVKRNRNEWTSFNIVRDLSDNYVIQNATTNCKNNLIIEEGVKYSRDEMSLEKFPTETITLPSSNSDIIELVKMACSIAEENRSITGDFDDGKALEILYGNYNNNSKTAYWENIYPPNTLENYDTFLGKTGSVKIIESKELNEDGNMKHVLLVSTSIKESQRFLISATVFIKKQSKWEIEKDYPYLKLVGKKEQTEIFDNNEYNPSSTVINRKLQSATVSVERIGVNKLAIIETVFDFSNRKTKYTTSENTSYEEDQKTKYLLVSNLENPNIPLINFEISSDYAEDLRIFFSPGMNDYNDAEISYNYIFSNRKEHEKKIYRFNKIAYIPIKKISDQLFEFDNKELRVEFYLTPILTQNDPSKEEFWINFDCGLVCEMYGSADTYQKINSQWKIIHQQNKIEEGGSCVEYYEHDTPTIQLSQNKIGFLVEAGECPGNHAGGESKKIYIYDSKNGWNNYGKITTKSWREESGAFDNKGNYIGESCEFEGKVSVIPNKTEYPIILVKGLEKCNKENIKKIKQQSDYYSFNGKQYNFLKTKAILMPQH